MNFDQTQSGTWVTVHPGEARSAGFSVSGTLGREVQVTFALPSAMTDDAGNSLPVFFGPDAAGYSTTDDPRSLLLFDPDDGLITSLNSVGLLYIWLGGTIHPDHTQRRGGYRTDISLNASYTTE